MQLSVEEFGRRVRSLQTEVEIANRTRQAEAARARKALDGIQEKDIELLAPIIPELPRVYKFTVQEILNNEHGEVEAITAVVESLRSYLDQRLSYYEEQL